MPQKVAISAGAVILREINGELKIALAQRGERASKPRKVWAVPKGHVEEGETIEQTVHREIFEETGLTGIQLIKYLGNVGQARFLEEFAVYGLLDSLALFNMPFEDSPNFPGFGGSLSSLSK